MLAALRNVMVQIRTTKRENIRRSRWRCQSRPGPRLPRPSLCSTSSLGRGDTLARVRVAALPRRVAPGLHHRHRRAQARSHRATGLRSPVERTRQRPHNMPWPSAMAVAPPVPGRQAYFRLFRSSVTVYSYPGRTTSIPPSAEAYAVRACVRSMGPCPATPGPARTRRPMPPCRVSPQFARVLW